jgi:hypothetical protein
MIFKRIDANQSSYKWLSRKQKIMAVVIAVGLGILIYLAFPQSY